MISKIKSFTNKIKYKNTINLIDVGSAEELPQPWKDNQHLIDRLLTFEPRDENLSDKKLQKDVALWEKKCKKNFYIYEGLKNSGSSLLKQNYDYVEKNYQWLVKRGSYHRNITWKDRSKLVKTVKVECETLDRVIEEIKEVKFNFMKIDSQGAEYQILKGGKNFLKNDCIGLHLELFTIPLYKDMKLFGDVLNILNPLGFELMKVFPASGSFSSQHDAIFIKRNENSTAMHAIKSLYRI